MLAELFEARGTAYIVMMRLRPLFSFILAQWPWIALASSLSMLAIAHGFERFGGLAPCALCLHQREAYWIAAAIATLALLARRMEGAEVTNRALNLLLTFAFVGGAIVAGFHMGVEYKWWPGLPSCTAASSGAVPTDLIGALNQPLHVVGCDEAPWIFLGLSMAGWNMLISLKLAIYSGLSVFYPRGLSEKSDV
ncbi:MAG: disulfide bond formation protein B [Aquidulcibacter sp.]|jgi:disulfide bond formation protein DsbB|uniref:disulfide bond formation protein B n=1 Tax=Aquidulcibacter sp. TaxID=2052990 RepID=UPI0022C5D9CC|nr:disulfide bond formation protein B [Aquidulcibacter sp.]